ncbi:MAG: RecX family transcriptional regulator [Actinobacteria bacterium]|nr:RecX family transcriptional regulator [Actinomycetota bacterium]
METRPPDTAQERLQRALELAYRYLNRRERTEAEVRQRLERDDLGSATVEAAISTLNEQGYLDDSRFARLFTEDKRQLEQWGSDRIRRSLRQRGIDPELIETALGEPTARSELEQALELLRRRFSQPPADRRERDRALGVLLRKGYEMELALAALAAYRFAPPQPRY